MAEQILNQIIKASDNGDYEAVKSLYEQLIKEVA